jgi:NAD(P)-dependent dehydrogenase (short-subunit alcohol dehydrogenase family)
MRDLTGKTAFVTGGASGIGLALGRACAEAGMRVMLADIEETALDAAVESFGGGAEVRCVRCDVTDYESVERAARAALDAFGKVHLVCNNAGVSGREGGDEISLAEWRWVIDVNLLGAVHGVKAFLPILARQGEGGHFVNTASMAGFLPGIGFSPYVATKFAVVGMSEGLAIKLAPAGIGVSVLCPGWVNTRISTSERNRPASYGAEPPRPPTPLEAKLAQYVKNGLAPEVVAALVLDAVRENRLYIFTHPHMRPPLENRFARVLDAYRALGPVPQETRR